jgi:phosphatidylserine decarboxylase
MKDGIIISVLSIIPKKPVARIMGRASRIQLPTFLHRLLIRYFVWKYTINLDECEGSIEDFNSLSEFFIRPLKVGKRKIDLEKDIFVSPADGKVHSYGRIKNGDFFQSESQVGNISELLGSGQESPGFSSERYWNGSFIIIYLSPQDYHRVHLHGDGYLTSARYQPGRLWPVFPAATRKIPSLFDRNERLLFSLENKRTYSVLAMIGAFGVGRMTTTHFDLITNTNTPAYEHRFSEPLSQKRGSEIGRFELGSTVILLFDEDLHWNVTNDQKLRLGEKIASKVLP